jgi:amino-acid N-acetyltransferase
MDTISQSQIELIREVFHYRSRFENSTMVFKIDYPVTEDPAFPGIVKDIALLVKTGIKMVIVPGIKENMEMAAFNAASRFMTFFSGSGVEAVIGSFTRARARTRTLGVINGIDCEHSGTVDKIFTGSLVKVCNLGMIPILPCIGWNASGKAYNVPGDEIAFAAASALGAAKLFIVSVHDGLHSGILKLPEKTVFDNIDRYAGRIIKLTPQETEALIAANSGVQSDTSLWYLEKLKLALRASRAGVHRIHLVDGKEEGSILKELFSNLGSGTMIYTDEYESIRGINLDDLPEILRLMEPLMQMGILVRRSLEQIQEKIDDYAVFEIDGSIHACGALHDWGEAQGEIAAIASDPFYSDMGMGRQIVSYLIDKARKSGMRRVFVLTTQTHDWFERLGFREAPVESLPEQKRRLYDKNRNSKVFALEL